MNRQNLKFTRTAGVLSVVGYLAAAASIVGFFGRFGWLQDLCSQFRLCYVYFFLLLVVVYAFKRSWRLTAFYLLFLAINAPTAYCDLVPAAHAGTISGGIPLRVLQMNIWVANHDYQRICNYIEDRKPDIVGIEEYSRRADAALAELGLFKTYPYHIWMPTSDRNSETALFSRYPLTNVHAIVSSTEHDRSLVADANISGHTVSVVVMHPRPPVRPTLYARACQQFKTLASQRSTMNQDLIVIGDLNTTQYSWKFSDFLTAMNLRDTRVGYGPAPSWLVWLPVLPIDFILTSQSIRVVHFGLGTPSGSDHLPVMCDLVLGKSS